MRRAYLILLLLFVSSATRAVWILPDDTNGSLKFPSFIFADTIRNGSENNYALKVALSGDFSCKSTFGEWHIPGICLYWPDPTDQEKFITVYQGWVNTQIGQGDFTLSIEGSSEGPFFSEKSATVTWMLSEISAPLFGLPQVTQKGDQSPYASGDHTIAQRGCCLCSLLAWGKYLAECPWSPSEFNQVMVKENGYWGNDVKIPRACYLLNLDYIGRYKYKKVKQEWLEKWRALGWGTVAKVWAPHKDKKGAIGWHQHWVDITPGVIQKDHKIYYGLMDPALRSSYTHRVYRIDSLVVVAPKNMKTTADVKLVPSVWTQNYWWKNPENQYSKPYWKEKTSLNSFDNLSCVVNFEPLEEGFQEPILIPFYYRIDAETSKDVFITKIETPKGILTEDTSSEDETLFKDFVDEEGEYHDDEIWDFSEEEIQQLEEMDVPTLENCSVAGMRATPGRYVFYLSGKPNAWYNLRCFINNGELQEKNFSGVLDEGGNGIVVLDFEAKTIVLRTGGIRNLPAGTLITLEKEVTFSSEKGYFFIEDYNRAAGAKILWNGEAPPRGSLVSVTGKVLETKPEIIIQGETVEIISLSEPSIKPLMIKSPWPEMANCLLAKLWGRVVTAEDGLIKIDSGSGLITLKTEQQIGIGSFITFEAVLTNSQELEPIPETIQQINN